MAVIAQTYVFAYTLYFILLNKVLQVYDSIFSKFIFSEILTLILK